MNPVVFIIFDLSRNHDFFWNWVFHEKIIKNCWGYLEKQTHFLILSQNHCFSLYHQPFLMKKIGKNRFHQISRFRDRSNIIKSLGFIFYAKRMVLNVRKKCTKLAGWFEILRHFEQDSVVSAQARPGSLDFPDFSRFACDFNGLVLGAQWELDNKPGHFWYLLILKGSFLAIIAVPGDSRRSKSYREVGGIW